MPLPIEPEEPDELPLPIEPEEPDELPLPIEPEEPDESEDAPLLPAPVEPLVPLEPEEVPAPGGQSALDTLFGPQSALLAPDEPVVPEAPLEPEELPLLGVLLPDELSIDEPDEPDDMVSLFPDEPLVPDVPLDPEESDEVAGEEDLLAPVLAPVSPYEPPEPELDEPWAKAMPAALNNAIKSADDFFMMFLQYG